MYIYIYTVHCIYNPFQGKKRQQRMGLSKMGDSPMFGYSSVTHISVYQNTGLKFQKFGGCGKVLQVQCAAIQKYKVGLRRRKQNILPLFQHLLNRFMGQPRVAGVRSIPSESNPSPIVRSSVLRLFMTRTITASLRDPTG